MIKSDMIVVNQTTDSFPFQTMKKGGIIQCVRMGYIIVDIPKEWKIKDAEVRGFSTHKQNSYYDIALNGNVLLHIFRWNLGNTTQEPFFFEEYPL